MTRAVSPALLRSDDLDDIEDFRDVLGQWRRLGGKSAMYANQIAARIDRLPDARLARRDAAVIAFAASFQGPPDRKQRERMASALARYATTGWLRERLGTVEGAKDAAMFAVLKNSPKSGPPGERTIREILGKNQMLLPARASAHNSNHLNEEAA